MTFGTALVLPLWVFVACSRVKFTSRWLSVSHLCLDALYYVTCLQDGRLVKSLLCVVCDIYCSRICVVWVGVAEVCVKWGVVFSAIVTAVGCVYMRQQPNGEFNLTKLTNLIPRTFTSHIKPYPCAVVHRYGLPSYFNRLMYSTMLWENRFIAAFPCWIQPDWQNTQRSIY